MIIGFDTVAVQESHYNVRYNTLNEFTFLSASYGIFNQLIFIVQVTLDLLDLQSIKERQRFSLESSIL